MHYSCWDSRASTEDSNAFLTKIALVHAARINSHTVRECLTSYLTSGDILALCNYSPAYEELSAWDASNVRQISAFFQKRGDIDVGVNRKRVAIDGFIAAEKLCAQTNDIYRMRARGEFSFPPRVEAVLLTAQRKVATMLGDVPSLGDLKFRFGPGATTQVQKRMASPAIKLGETFACSEDMLPIVSDFLSEFPTWVDYHAVSSSSESWTVPLEIHPGRLRFVPKSYKTDRSIVVEPMLNSFAQLGICDYLSDRFRRFGLDLTDQSANQRAALEGSLTGALATLDLSSASDTLAYNLVLDLFPIDWFVLLSQFRSGTVDCEGTLINMEKFASMGNGYTFAVESLIFYALAYACVAEEDSHRVSVFGDDIIIPTYGYPLLAEVLCCVGCILNKDKSFATGPFRESCGADYLRGISIRPSYVKDSLALFDVFRLHNQYVRRGDEEIANLLLAEVPASFQKWGPDGFGDGHLIGDGGLRPHGRDRGWAGFSFETYTLRPRRDFSVRPGDRVYPFYTTYLSPEGYEASRALGLRDWAVQFDAVGREVPVYRSGVLGVGIPGTEGVNLIKIYTLSTRGG